MIINFNILFIFISFLFLLFIFSVLLVSDYKTRYVIVSKNLSFLSIFFLFGICYLLYQLCFFFISFSIQYSSICFYFSLPTCIIFIVLVAFFLFFSTYFFDFIYKMEEIVVLMSFVFIAIFAISSRDLLSLFVCLEGINLCLFVLLLSTSNDIKSAEATLKYVLISILASLFFIFGILLVYTNWGVFSYTDISLLLRHSLLSPVEESILGYMGLVFLLLGFTIKLGVFPFYSWMINVFRGFSPKGLVFVSVLSKTVFLILFLNFIYYVSFLPYLKIMFLILGCGSLLVGTFYLFYTSAIRDFIAFSSLTSTGFLLLVWISFTEFVVFTSIFYIVIQAFNLLFFFCFCSFFRTEHVFPFSFYQMRNYLEVNMLFFSSFIFSVFSLIGIPPLAGFFPKLFMIGHLFSVHNFIVLFIFSFFTILSCFYFIRLLRFFSVNVFSFNSDVSSSPVLFLTRSFFKFKVVIFLFLIFNISVIIFSYIMYVSVIVV